MMEKQDLKSRLAYWIPTGFVALNWTFGAIASLMKSKMSMDVFRHLGYPDYFATLLGSAQLLGVIAILAPVPRTVREWAYAGLTFDVVAAIFSILAVDSSISKVGFPVTAAAVLLMSYRGWKEHLKMSGE